MKNSIWTSRVLVIGAIAISALTITACGGGSTNDTSASDSLTPTQISALTAGQIAAFYDSQISGLGTNISYLSDSALNALTYGTLPNSNQNVGQIGSITVAQIAALSPAQVRMIGAAGPGGSVTTSGIQYLNPGAWAALVSKPSQVAAITAAEVATLWDSKIVAIGTNISYLSNASLNALSYATLAGNSNHNVGQIESLTVTQIEALSPAQIAVLAGIDLNIVVGKTGIAWLNSGAFSALNSTQVNVLLPINMLGVSAAQLASLTPSAIAGFAPATIASLTAQQKSLLSPAQHTACGC